LKKKLLDPKRINEKKEWRELNLWSKEFRREKGITILWFLTEILKLNPKASYKEFLLNDSINPMISDDGKELKSKLEELKSKKSIQIDNVPDASVKYIDSIISENLGEFKNNFHILGVSAINDNIDNVYLIEVIIESSYFNSDTIIIENYLKRIFLMYKFNHIPQFKFRFEIGFYL
jgi:hypothetical protein